MIGKFITFEGGEGSGKSTQSKLLHQYLRDQGVDAIWTREIGGTPEAEKIRNLIMQETLTDFSELLMIFAARHEHITNLIVPALKEGKYVICDRFIDSSIAYSPIAMDKILALYKSIWGEFMPDTTFFIDIDPETGLSRAISRGDSNKFELKSLSFHKNVYSKFKDLKQHFPSRIIEIDGSNNIDTISAQIIEKLKLDLKGF